MLEVEEAIDTECTINLDVVFDALIIFRLQIDTANGFRLCTGRQVVLQCAAGSYWALLILVLLVPAVAKFPVSLVIVQ